jgi:predicted GIY-YIG superfamily endonuclease
MNTPGIYMLYDLKGQCLYVGCSRDMEQRVKQHRLTKTFERVEFFPCAVEDFQAREREWTEAVEFTRSREEEIRQLRDAIAAINAALVIRALLRSAPIQLTLELLQEKLADKLQGWKE